MNPQTFLVVLGQTEGARTLRFSMFETGSNPPEESTESTLEEVLQAIRTSFTQGDSVAVRGQFGWLFQGTLETAADALEAVETAVEPRAPR